MPDRAPRALGNAVTGTQRPGTHRPGTQRPKPPVLDIFAADEQADLLVELDTWVRLTRDVLTDRGVAGEAELSLLFVDETTIARLNRTFLDRDGPTDVLSFPIEDDPEPVGRFPDSGGSGPGSETATGPPMLLGDVVICPAVAARQAVENAVDVEDELALLVVHGILHLLGMDHVDDDEAERMEQLERTLLSRFHHSRTSEVQERPEQ
ncbi:MAG: rRNA maturation RNase YbeY [Acidimicrobiales bacterium]